VDIRSSKPVLSICPSASSPAACKEIGVDKNTLANVPNSSEKDWVLTMFMQLSCSEFCDN
jgi:hypothetical protein